MIDVDRGIAYNYQVVSSVFGEIILEESCCVSCCWEGPGQYVFQTQSRPSGSDWYEIGWERGGGSIIES